MGGLPDYMGQWGLNSISQAGQDVAAAKKKQDLLSAKAAILQNAYKLAGKDIPEITVTGDNQLLFNGKQFNEGLYAPAKNQIRKEKQVVEEPYKTTIIGDQNNDLLLNPNSQQESQPSEDNGKTQKPELDTKQQTAIPGEPSQEADPTALDTKQDSIIENAGTPSLIPAPATETSEEKQGMTATEALYGSLARGDVNKTAMAAQAMANEKGYIPHINLTPPQDSQVKTYQPTVMTEQTTANSLFGAEDYGIDELRILQAQEDLINAYGEDGRDLEYRTRSAQRIKDEANLFDYEPFTKAFDLKQGKLEIEPGKPGSINYSFGVLPPKGSGSRGRGRKVHTMWVDNGRGQNGTYAVDDNGLFVDQYNDQIQYAGSLDDLEEDLARQGVKMARKVGGGMPMAGGVYGAGMATPEVYVLDDGTEIYPISTGGFTAVLKNGSTKMQTIQALNGNRPIMNKTSTDPVRARNLYNYKQSGDDSNQIEGEDY